MGSLLAQMEPGDGGMHSTVDSIARTPLSTVLLYAVLFTVVRWGLHGVISMSEPKTRGIFRFFSEAIDAVIYACVLVFFIVRPFLFQAYSIPSGSMVSTLLVDDYIVANKAIYRFQDPKIGDVVVFRPPKVATKPSEQDADGDVDVDFIKRCVGVPGDLVELRGDILYRNGAPVKEPFKCETVEDPPGQDLTYRNMRPDEIEAHPKEDFRIVNSKGVYWPLITYDGGINDTEMTAPDFRLDDETKAHQIANLPAARIPAGYYMMMGDNRFHSYDSRSWGLVPRSSIIGRAEAVWLPLSHTKRL